MVGTPGLSGRSFPLHTRRRKSPPLEQTWDFSHSLAPRFKIPHTILEKHNTKSTSWSIFTRKRSVLKHSRTKLIHKKIQKTKRVFTVSVGCLTSESAIFALHIKFRSLFKPFSLNHSLNWNEEDKRKRCNYSVFMARLVHGKKVRRWETLCNYSWCFDMQNLVSLYMKSISITTPNGKMYMKCMLTTISNKKLR